MRTLRKGPLRGEIWWVRLDPTRGSEIRKTRPCVVVGANELNARRNTVIVIPLSTARESAPPILVPVVCEGRHAVAVVDQIRAAAKERFERVIGTLTAEDLSALDQALRSVLELDFP